MRIFVLTGLVRVELLFFRPPDNCVAYDKKNKVQNNILLISQLNQAFFVLRNTVSLTTETHV